MCLKQRVNTPLWNRKVPYLFEGACNYVFPQQRFKRCLSRAACGNVFLKHRIAMFLWNSVVPCVFEISSMCAPLKHCITLSLKQRLIIVLWNSVIQRFLEATNYLFLRNSVLLRLIPMRFFVSLQKRVTMSCRSSVWRCLCNGGKPVHQRKGFEWLPIVHHA